MEPFRKFEEVLRRLETLKVPYDVMHVRDDALMIRVASPGRRWELEMMVDGSWEIEEFVRAAVRQRRATRRDG